MDSIGFDGELGVDLPCCFGCRTGEEVGVEGLRNDDSRLICACRKDDFSSELSRSVIFGDCFRNKQISFLLNNKTFSEFRYGQTQENQDSSQGHKCP